MKIKYNQFEDTRVRFDSLVPGQVFKVERTLFMVVSEKNNPNNERVNTVSLHDGKLVYTFSSSMVEIVEGYFVEGLKE